MDMIQDIYYNQRTYQNSAFLSLFLQVLLKFLTPMIVIQRKYVFDKEFGYLCHKDLILLHNKDQR